MSDELNFVQKARREKLDALVAAGVTPFAYGFERTHESAAAVAALPDGAHEIPVSEGSPPRTGQRWDFVSVSVRAGGRGAERRARAPS